MNITKRKCFSQPVLEGICRIIADTDSGLKGPEIGYFLAQCQIRDIDPNITKWKRLYSAFANWQNQEKCSNNILNFIGLALAPPRFVNNIEDFESKRQLVNQQLAFIGYELTDKGKFKEISEAKTISEAQQRANNLKQKLEVRNAHSAIFQYCKAELLVNNYFHSVQEAMKSLFQRIRDLSGLTTDGNALIEEAFSKNNPMLIINSWKSNSEKNEHDGFSNLLKGLCGMIRNPLAHEPKIEWDISEQDALEILSIISYSHRRLDNTQKIR